MKKSLKNSLLALLLCSGSLWGAPLNVVSSFSILGDVAQQLGGERVRVEYLVGADSDAHAHQLTGADVKKIKAAQLVLLNGLGFEQASMVRAVKQSNVPYIEAATGIAPLRANETAHDHAHDSEHHHGDFDPHVWHDPVRMQTYAANIVKAFLKIDPAGAAHYEARFRQFSQELIALDAFARAQFHDIPAPRRKVLTGHHSFEYLGKRYGIIFLAPQGVSTEAQPSAKTVAAIIRQIKQQGVKAVFTENIKDGRMVQRIAQETGVQVGGKLYSDALSRGAPAQSYAQMFRHNIQTMGAAMR